MPHSGTGLSSPMEQGLLYLPVLHAFWSSPMLSCQRWLQCVGMYRRGSRQRKPHTNSMGDVTSLALHSRCRFSPEDWTGSPAEKVRAVIFALWGWMDWSWNVAESGIKVGFCLNFHFKCMCEGKVRVKLRVRSRVTFQG